MGHGGADCGHWKKAGALAGEARDGQTDGRTYRQT